MSRQGCHQCFHKSRQFRFCSPFIPATTGCAMHQIPIVTTHGRPSIPIITLYPQPYQCRQKTESSREAHGWVLVNVSTGTSRRISRNPGLLIQEKPARPKRFIPSQNPDRYDQTNESSTAGKNKRKWVVALSSLNSHFAHNLTHPPLDSSMYPYVCTPDDPHLPSQNVSFLFPQRIAVSDVAIDGDAYYEHRTLWNKQVPKTGSNQLRVANNLDTFLATGVVWWW